MIGAALGGAAQGASQGLGRFSNALMQVMGAQQHRGAMRQQDAYRTHRDQVSDAAAAEAREMQQKTHEYRVASDDRNYELQQQESAQRQANSDRTFSAQLAGQGFMPVPEPAPMAEPGGAGMAPSGAGSDIAQQFMIGGNAYHRPQQPFDLRTDPQFLRSSAMAELQAGLRGPQQGTGMSDGQKEQIRRGLLTRLQKEDGSIDWLGLEDALDDIRKLPGATDDHIDFARNLFKRDF